MDAKTLEALKASIAKWERNAEAGTPSVFKTGPDDCPLCGLFNADETDDAAVCAGCPVAKKTKGRFCQGSPYDAAFKAWFAWSGFPADRDKRLAAHAAARDEVAFLRSLLLEETP
jgi:hypothetical protein